MEGLQDTVNFSQRWEYPLFSLNQIKLIHKNQTMKQTKNQDNKI